MSLERDAKLGKALEGALPSPNPPYGVKLRVRRGLDARLTRPRTSTSTAMALAFATLACLGALVFGLRPNEGSSTVDAQRSALTLRSARVLLRDGSAVTVERDDETGAVLRLTSGSILLHVQKGTGRSFEVVAGASRVRVVGTVFGVALGERGASVEVVEGVVEVTDEKGARRLRAGEAWPKGVRLFGDPRELEALRGPLRAPPTRVDAARPAPDPTPTPNATAPPPQAPSAAPRSPPQQTPAAPSPLAAVPPSAAPESRYARARGLEQAGDMEGALSAYQAMVDEHAPSFDDALFALARLRSQRGESSAALAVAMRYRNELPSGRYARDNDVLVLNRLLALGERARAVGEAETFLKAFPNDPRAWRFRLVRAAERARRSDCEGARADVETAPDGAAKRSVLESCPAERP